MKKTTILILSLCLLLSLIAGCATNNEASKSESSPLVSDVSNETSSDESEAETVKKDVILRFVAMSDVHVSSVGDEDYNRFRDALAAAYEYSTSQSYSSLDAVMIAGDMTNNGYESEMVAFKKGVDEFIKEGTKPLLITGNHEFFHQDGQEIIDRWERIMEQKINTHEVINGYHFIGVSLHGYSNYQPSLAWLEEELEKAAQDDPTKPIFVQQHYHLTDTVYGSDLWGTDVMTDILKKYPQVIDFSGHSHYPINDPRSIWQGDFTALGCGTLAYFELEPGMVYGSIPPNASNAAQYYIIEVHEDNAVTIKLYDLITDSFFDAEYYISNPSDKSSFKYTDARKNNNEAPKFEEGAEVVVSNISDTGAVVTIPQATDDEFPHSYRFDFYVDGKLDVSGMIWSEFYFKDMPETLSQSFSLLPATEYTVKVTAIDSWGKESEKPIEATFKTNGSNVPVDKDSPIPEADVLNVVFDENGATDNSRKKKLLVNNNSVKTAFDEEMGRYYADFDGINQNFIARYTRDEFSRVTDQVTMALGFKLDKFPGSYCNPFANMQSGGYGFEINVSSKKLEFWCCIGGSYQTVSATIEAETYYQVVGRYDGTEVALFVNGEKVASKAATGKITYPATDAALAFCVGSDISYTGEGEAFFDGKISYANVYSYAITDSQVNNIKNEG